ncbi:MAG: ATPase [Desulfurococcus sp.]|nr:ATPase [Desulfurococcus sp.]
MGLILSKPSEMLRVNVVFLREDKERILKILQEAGVIEIEFVEAEKIVREYEKLHSLAERVNSLLQRVKGLVLDVSVTGVEVSSIDITRIEKDVTELESEVSLVEERVKGLRRLADSLRTLLEAVNPLPGGMDAAEIYYEGKRVSSLLFHGELEAVEKLSEEVSSLGVAQVYVSGEHASLIAYIPSRDLNKVISKADSLGVWFPSKQLLEQVELKGDVHSLRVKLSERIKELEMEASSLEKKITETVRSRSEVLGKYLLILENQMQRYRALGLTTDLRHVSAVTGWIPKDSVKLLENLVRDYSAPVFIEYRSPVKGVDEPPTKFNNRGPVKFFQVITRLYGVPGYWEPDPTPIIAYSFALFFGIMNADAGYSLAGLLAILLFLDKLVEDPRSPIYREFKGALISLNIVSFILGFLSGSIFGGLLTDVFGVSVPSLITVFNNPLEFIKLALLVGFIHINIAHALATARFIRERRIGELLNEVGLFTTEVFGIPYIFKEFLKYDIPVLSAIPKDTLLHLTLLGLLILVAGNYLAMKGLGFMMWVFQLTGVLGDVMSYVRLAGIGMSTFYMAFAFNITVKMLMEGLASMLPGMAGVILAYAVSIPLLFIIHLFITFLSMLGAFVHSLRLVMLEFLMKFYDGAGREYSPLSIIASKRIVIPG